MSDAAPSEHRVVTARRGRLASLGRWAVAALAGPAAVSLFVLADIGEVAAALLYVLAVAATAYAAGTRAGLLAAGASFVAYEYLFTPPANSFRGAGDDDAVALLVFVAVAGAMSFVVGRERALRADAEAAWRRAESGAERMRRLERVARALLEADSPDEVLDVVLERGVGANNARAGLVGLLSEDGATLEIVAQQGYAAGDVDGWGPFSIDDQVPLADAIRTREPVFLATTAERNRRYPLLASHPADRSHSLVCLPLVFEGAPKGVIGLSFEGEEEFDANRRMLNVALAALAAQAIERARIRDAERQLRDKLAFLAEASEVLSQSLEYEATLQRIAELAVPRIGDWCTVDVVDEDGRIRRVAAVHDRSEVVRALYELRERHPFDPDAPIGVPHVIRTGEPDFRVSTTDEVLREQAAGDEDLLESLRRLGPRALMTVPLAAGGMRHGALTLVIGEPGRPGYTQADLELALDLARRAAAAIDNAQLYRQAERRAEAARALHYVADAVVLVGTDDCPRFVNPAAERLLASDGGDVASGWTAVLGAVEAAAAGQPSATVPVALAAGERWLRVTRADFPQGSVYALHDVTDEWALERTRSDFVATASHELRTPLAAVYGSIQTLLRDDLPDNGARRMLLELGARECRRLAEIIEHLLLAGQLDQGQLRLSEGVCDAREIAAEVVESVSLRISPEHALELDAEEEVPEVWCDAPRLRQALLNLVDNAVKYSPAGGRVGVRVAASGPWVKIDVEDEGLGIPPEQQGLVFEKFYRLDPALSRGVGGAGLGLYITRQLVERMRGTLELRSRPTGGSTFTITLPARRGAA